MIIYQIRNFYYYYHPRYFPIRLLSDLRKEDIQIKAVKSRAVIKDVLEKKREFLIKKKNVIVKDIREKKNDIVKDIQEKKTKVKEKMEEVIERENIITIPNILTIGRAGLAPYLGYLIIQSDFTIAMGLFVVAGITDLVIQFFYFKYLFVNIKDVRLN